MARHFRDVPTEKTVRFSSGVKELDWQYGSDPGSTSFGLPCGVLSLWGGSGGVGKTRTTVSVANRVMAQGGSVLWFSLEMSEGRFIDAYCRGIPSGAKFFVSEEKSLAAQVSAVQHLKPTLVIVDSINRIREYRKITTRTDIETLYRAVAKVTGSHIIFITHLNMEGNIKGGSDLPHMVDVVFYLEKLFEGQFKISCPDKNRFGKTGTETWWIHDAHGAHPTSNHRLDDEDWRKSHGITDSDVLKARAGTFSAIDTALRGLKKSEERSDESKLASGLRIWHDEPRLSPSGAPRKSDGTLNWRALIAEITGGFKDEWQKGKKRRRI